MVRVGGVALLYLLVRYFWLLLSRRRREERRDSTFVFGLAFIAGVVIWNIAAATGNTGVLAAIIPIPVATTVWEVRFRGRKSPGDPN